MTPAGIQRILTTASLIEQYKVTSEKRIAGGPCQGLVNVFSDPGGEFHVGIWEGEPAIWRVAYSETEYCEILAGPIRMTDAAGMAMEVGLGDRFVIAAGFCGTWEVLERARKIFVIFERKSG